MRVRGRSCSFTLDGFSDQGTASGFDAIDGVRPINRACAAKGPLLTTGKLCSLHLAVLGDRLIAELDRKVIEDWSGNPMRLSPYLPGEFGQPSRLRLTTFNTSYRITALCVFPVLEPKPAAPSAVAASLPAPPENLDLKVAQPVDLLRSIGGTANTFRRQGRNVVTEANTLSKFYFSQPPPESYIFEARVTRLSPLESISISFPLGGFRGAWVIDGWKTSGGPFSGLEMIDGRRVPDNQTGQSGQQIADGQSADLRLIVLPGRVMAQIDGKTVLNWEGRSLATDGDRIYEALPAGKNRDCDPFRQLFDRSAVVSRDQHGRIAGRWHTGNACDADAAGNRQSTLHEQSPRRRR